MRKAKYPLNNLERFFRTKRIATFEQVRGVLGNPARCTVFRKLHELHYLSSYSHRGKFYTLVSITRFNAQGLWTYQSVWFSRFGNLLKTAEEFVRRSKAGYSAMELKELLQVKTKHALTQLVRASRLQRDKVGGVYIYYARDKTTAREQHKARELGQTPSLANVIISNSELATEEAKAAILLFSSLLDEKQRRLYAGLESLKLGYGGDTHIANLLGMSPHTVARGRRELIVSDLPIESKRTPGGGRTPIEKKRPKS